MTTNRQELSRVQEAQQLAVPEEMADFLRHYHARIHLPVRALMAVAGVLLALCAGGWLAH